LDRNRNHFPTLLISCVLCSIILFVSALIISSIQQKKIKSNQNTKQIGEDEQEIETHIEK
jgi:CHASE3 domain sensor protein